MDESEVKPIERVIQVWEKVIDVQMHFNDLCLRLRSIAVSTLGVLLAASAIAYKYAGVIEVCNYKVMTATFFIGISIFVWLAFFLMDRYWYHELLKGAMHHAKKIEATWESDIPEISLVKSVRQQSHSSLKMDAGKKLNIFYLGILVVQLIVLYFLVSNSIKIS
ncbi:hypothetical protein [Vibrio parahaemolyticus]|uniref:hypothetical protein n=1 Tax=Vibrio parahaemolyticus TaxID=670 RepID=UPI0005429EDB|nr:hypothetical protein [Vibrio parahaemolyticus]EHR6474890.1 hypothetical protein [Vibrio parahaemolyticus]KHF16996.1 hypothetical protein PO81_21525 [Vibrio parahaemolyticus]MBE3686820.1 hypothetical protein [Vibrio parahaemolyticus]